MPEEYAGERYTDYEDTINWDQVGVPVAIGRYDAEVTACEYRKNNAGKHMLETQFKILNALEPQNDAMKDRILFENFTFTQQAAFRIKGFAKGAGLTLPSIINQPVLEEFAATIVGVTICVEVKHRIWEGEPRANISRFHPIGATSITAQGDADVPEPEPEPDLQRPELAKASIRDAVTQNLAANGTRTMPRAPAVKPQPARR